MKMIYFKLILCFVLSNVGNVFPKVYNKLELAEELSARNNNLFQDIDTWLCVIRKESSYNTNAFNRYNGDHGLFQINEQYWCDPQNGKRSANVCSIPCQYLRDDDITDDIECVKRIFSIHGFKAWAVYQSCQNKSYVNKNANSLPNGLINQIQPYSSKWNNKIGAQYANLNHFDSNLYRITQSEQYSRPQFNTQWFYTMA